MNADVRVFQNADALSLGAAEAVTAAIEDAVHARGRCSLVLSGGSTPRPLYALLASRFRDRIPWAHVHVFWGDERCVPHDDERSNYRMASAALLDHVPCPPANVHPMPTHPVAADDAAWLYEQTLRRYISGGTPRFDVVLLGLGREGHTASLFPGSPALTERTRWVVPVIVPAVPPERLTLTVPVLSASHHIHFLVTGTDKAHALHSVLAGEADPNICPASAFRQGRGTVTWWVDRDAAMHFIDGDASGGGR